MNNRTDIEMVAKGGIRTGMADLIAYNNKKIQQ
jgi:hypothetical protein